MPQQSTRAAADPVEADGNMTDDNTTHRAPPTRGSFRGRGRVAKVTRAKNAKITKVAPPPKPAGRGRRQKMYESVKTQAMYERAQDLKLNFSTAAKALKPALQELAERTTAELLEDPTAIARVPEFQASQHFLSQRHRDTDKQIHARLDIETAMAEQVWGGQQEAVHAAYETQLAELTDERYGHLLLMVDVLEYLHDNNLPIKLAPSTEDAEYTYKEITQKQADEQSTYVEMRDGVEVPFTGIPCSELLAAAFQLPPKVAPKRKAEGQPEGQPASKIAKDDDANLDMPRHSGGLLAAEEALEGRGSTPPESRSNAPTPPSGPLDAPSPGNIDQPQSSGVTTPRDPLEIPIPRGTSAADEHGVRIVTRRPGRSDAPNNRIMVPNLFEWDDQDIGFRDSTNSIQKGATKARRGRYIGKPGSNFMFVDRRFGSWDSTKEGDDLDEALIKKHGLHPTLGIVLPTSINEAEPPKPPVSGWKPVALVAPDGKIIHASRTIPPARLDRKVDRVEKKMNLKRQLATFCEKEGISVEDIAPEQEIRDKHRLQLLVGSSIDPDQLEQEEMRQEETSNSAEEAAASHNAFNGFVDSIISYASVAEADEAAAQAQAQVQPQPLHPSRPYDAIRDVFTDNAQQASQISQQPIQIIPGPDPMMAADTSSLSCLADAAEQQLHYKQHPPPLGSVYGLPMVDPMGYNQVSEHAQPGEFALPPFFGQQNDGNDFMRTALNPPPAGYEADAAGRNPFSNDGAAKALPALRPVRSLLNETPPPEPHGSPVPQHPSMVVSNSGAFFPPAPHRPFHNGFSIQEQGQMQGMQPGMQQPLASPVQPAVIPGPRPMSPYSVSPPPYHGGHPPLAPVLAAAPAPVPVPTTSPLLGQPTNPATPSPRSRPGSSSASSSKYRKLEPAPTPPHRMGYSANGQELRTVQFDYREAIKDYTPVEAPPRTGPTTIRGWTHNNQGNIKKSRPSSKGDASTDEPS
ncbi:hypothetical protein B0T17DRAFT_494104 [Bombardia bombarda]|uniref:Uncharacterized protein n=1 Tax=Bombardia bombarda TaxID=252184 RepID=A0AA39WTZ7_9PEZI|nr:hypothetical protein B0T17DRAFT_494104 [Bombardia bombarda]